jgi:transposase-like protein
MGTDSIKNLSIIQFGSIIRFCLSLRDVEELLAERGITVNYQSIRRWCSHFGPEYTRA